MAVLHHMNKAQLPKYFTAAGKSDVIHLIVVCWALLFQFFGGEHIVHIRWLTTILFHACEDIKFIIFLSCALYHVGANLHQLSCENPSEN